MANYQTEAILLAVRNIGDADKIVTLFTREHGKIIAFANGARRPRNSLSSGMQLFTHVDLVISSGKNSQSIKQCDILNAFRQITEDLTCMSYGMFIAEIVIELFPEGQPEPSVFDLLLQVLAVLTKRNPRLVALAWAWQLLTITGYRPEFSKCVVCGKELKYPVKFSSQQGGCLCKTCESHDLPVVDEKMLEFITCLLKIDWSMPEPFTVNSAVMLRTEKILLHYLQYYLDKPLKSMEFIKEVATVT